MTFREFLATTTAPVAQVAETWEDVVGIELDAKEDDIIEMRARLEARA